MDNKFKGVDFMKNVVIYYVGGRRYSEMVLKDNVCKELSDWFKDDYSGSKMEIEVDDTIKILNKNLICEIDITKMRD